MLSKHLRTEGTPTISLNTEYSAGAETGRQATELKDSMMYSRHIQRGMMANEKNLLCMFSTSFLMDRPKNIIGGDFFWLTCAGDTVIVAVADCTGHGIPGALMSILGNSLLNQIVLGERIMTPSGILQQLDARVQQSFSLSHQPGSSVVLDGMDISLCAINKAEQTIIFAGAYRPAYIVNCTTIDVLRGESYAIGGRLYKTKEFRELVIRYRSGDRLYLFSDGYADQFGGPCNKKFMSRRFRDVLMQISDLPMQRQKAILEKIFDIWRGENEQTDDVLVAGIRLP